MKIDWTGVIKDLRNLSPALYGRLIRHILTLLAGVGLIKGLSADQTNALQGLIEIAGSAVLFGVTILLSHNSDSKLAQNPMSEQDLERLIREVTSDTLRNDDLQVPLHTEGGYYPGHVEAPKVPRVVLPPNYAPPKPLGETLPAADANDSYSRETPPSVPPTGGAR